MDTTFRGVIQDPGIARIFSKKRGSQTQTLILKRRKLTRPPAPPSQHCCLPTVAVCDRLTHVQLGARHVPPHTALHRKIQKGTRREPMSSVARDSKVKVGLGVRERERERF